MCVRERERERESHYVCGGEGLWVAREAMRGFVIHVNLF